MLMNFTASLKTPPLRGGWGHPPSSGAVSRALKSPGVMPSAQHPAPSTTLPKSRPQRGQLVPVPAPAPSFPTPHRAAHQEARVRKSTNACAFVMSRESRVCFYTPQDLEIHPLPLATAQALPAGCSRARSGCQHSS